MPNMPGRSLLVPETLNVKGRGLSPQPPPNPASPEDATMLSVPTSSRTSMSDDEMGSEQSEEYTVLDGVREMNHILVRQIETLRMKIKIDEKNYDNEKARIVETKDSEIKARETEIEDLRESLTSRDEKITQLRKASDEKDKTIQSKCIEIEDLKQMVMQTKDYAQKIQRQVGRVRHQKDALELDPLYKQQNDEIKRLTEELELLKERLSTMESELARALTVIEQQNEKLKDIDNERAAMQAKFREDLDKASKAMRQEVERMREVMRQNYEEMRNLREQNREMHSDVRAIKEMLRASRAGAATNRDYQGNITGIQRPLTAVTANQPPSYALQTHGQMTAVAPIGPGKMVGGKVTQSPPTRLQHGVQGTQLQTQNQQRPLVRESTQFTSQNGRVANSRLGQTRISDFHDGSGHSTTVTTSRLSPDMSARTVNTGSTTRGDTTYINPQNVNVPYHNDAGQKNLPPICSLKEGAVPLTGQQSGRGRKPSGIIRKGSALRK